MSDRISPPKLFLRFFRCFCHPKMRDYIEGDLTEVYEKRLKKSGKRIADIRFVIDVILLFRPGIIRPVENHQQLNNYDMIRSYFKIGWRNLFRNKGFSTIKILGLSIGLAVCILIVLYSNDEISYDQFHGNKDRIYRITQNIKISNQPERTTGNSNGILGETFAAEIPEVNQYVRMTSRVVVIKNGEDVLTEEPQFVDNNFLSVFTVSVIHGSERTVLNDPHSAVITRDIAVKYFGLTDVVGRVMQIKLDTTFENFNITAVIENWPQNSTLKAGILIPYEFFKKGNSGQGWIGGNLDTFLLLSETSTAETVISKMQEIFDRNIADRVAKAKQQGVTIQIKLGLQPLIDMHLGMVGPGKGMAEGGKPIYFYILSCFAVFVLVVACINFINLAIAQSLKRSKEIGVRKVVGSSRKELIRQFLTESFLVTSIAFALALAIAILVLPFFNELAGKKLSLLHLPESDLYGGYLILLLVTSVIAGFYPSLVLSSFQPVQVLYKRDKFESQNYMTKGLIVVQFALTTALVIGTLVINSQLDFIHNADLGYDPKHLVRIDLPSNSSSNQLPELFRSELITQPGITSIAASNSGRTISGVTIEEKQIEIEYSKIDEAYLTTLGATIVAGRNFSLSFPADHVQSVIVNESFVKQAGWKLNEAIGMKIGGQHNNEQVTVIGVVKDYHFLSLKELITPQVFSMHPSISFGELYVKISSDNIPRTMALLQRTYSKLVPYYPFAFQFMEEVNARNYLVETRWKQIITITASLFIFISCIGLIGIVALYIEQHTKEVGIRKILGASMLRIFILISKEFIFLVSIAFVVALPAGYYYADMWLQTFAYRIHVEWWLLLLGGASVIVIALLTISFQTIKASLGNPVNNLRSE